MQIYQVSPTLYVDLMKVVRIERLAGIWNLFFVDGYQLPLTQQQVQEVRALLAL